MDSRKPIIEPLDEVLHQLRLSGTFYCRGEFETPWGVAFPETPREARFHLIVEGQAVLYAPGIAPITLREGDFALLARGAGHNIADAMTSPLMQYADVSPEYLSDRYAQFRYGAGGPGTRLICVSVKFEDPTAQRLIDLLPPAIHVTADALDQEWIQNTVRFIAAEAKDLRAGGETIITRLADILVIQAIRWWMEHEPHARVGWLAALKDRQIGRVIALIHRRPEHPWSLSELAREAAMSRSALTARFREMVGQSVMRYLAAWRMHLALRSLKGDRVDLGQLAEQVGYESESAFNRAFKRYVGVPPGSVRRSDA